MFVNFSGGVVRRSNLKNLQSASKEHTVYPIVLDESNAQAKPRPFPPSHTAASLLSAFGPTLTVHENRDSSRIGTWTSQATATKPLRPVRFPRQPWHFYSSCPFVVGWTLQDGYNALSVFSGMAKEIDYIADLG